jgi:hypothetical protein
MSPVGPMPSGPASQLGCRLAHGPIKSRTRPPAHPRPHVLVPHRVDLPSRAVLRRRRPCQSAPSAAGSPADRHRPAPQLTEKEYRGPIRARLDVVVAGVESFWVTNRSSSGSSPAPPWPLAPVAPWGRSGGTPVEGPVMGGLLRLDRGPAGRASGSCSLGAGLEPHLVANGHRRGQRLDGLSTASQR